MSQVGSTAHRRSADELNQAVRESLRALRPADRCSPPIGGRRRDLKGPTWIAYPDQAVRPDRPGRLARRTDCIRDYSTGIIDRSSVRVGITMYRDPTTRRAVTILFVPLRSGRSCGCAAG